MKSKQNNVATLALSLFGAACTLAHVCEAQTATVSVTLTSGTPDQVGLKSTPLPSTGWDDPRLYFIDAFRRIA